MGSFNELVWYVLSKDHMTHPEMVELSLEWEIEEYQLETKPSTVSLFLSKESIIPIKRYLLFDFCILF